MNLDYRQHDDCPFCGSENIEQSGYERDDGVFIAEYECQVCSQKWYEYYHFDHNEDDIGNFF